MRALVLAVTLSGCVTVTQAPRFVDQRVVGTECGAPKTEAWLDPGARNRVRIVFLQTPACSEVVEQHVSVDSETRPHLAIPIGVGLLVGVTAGTVGFLAVTTATDAAHPTETTRTGIFQAAGPIALGLAAAAGILAATPFAFSTHHSEAQTKRTTRPLPGDVEQVGERVMTLEEALALPPGEIALSSDAQIRLSGLPACASAHGAGLPDAERLRLATICSRNGWDFADDVLNALATSDRAAPAPSTDAPRLSDPHR